MTVLDINHINRVLNESFLCEDVEGKNINRAEKFIKQNYPEYLNKELTLPNGDRKTMTARDWVTQVRNDIPSSRLPKNENGKDTCKFLLGVTRLYFGFTKDTRQDQIQSKISQLEKIMKILVTSHLDEYDNNLNGLSYNDLDTKFSGTIKKNLDNEVANLKNKEFKRDTSYEIVTIPDFETASQYGKYTSWCVTHNEDMYDSYTKNGLGLFYFCLKDGFENVRKEKGEGCPLDEYGKSMIAISVNEDGSLNTATCRWNHDNGGNDNIFKDATQVSEFFGINFFDTFKPRTIDELLSKFKKNAIPSNIADKFGGVETEDGIHIVKDGRIRTYKKCYKGKEGICYAYDHFYWFNEEGDEIQPPLNVGGTFGCSHRPSLTSLEGAPQTVSRDFYCDHCTSLTSLEGAPREVGLFFDCSYCTSLTSLEGAPQTVSRDFYCDHCTSLTSLEGAPQTVGGDFLCYRCSNLTSLEGAPQNVERDFNCLNCKSLTTLRGAPQKVGGNFNCSNCSNLVSLKGAPQKIGIKFICDDTKISSLQKQNYLKWLKTNPKETYHEFNSESILIDFRKLYNKILIQECYK